MTEAQPVVVAHRWRFNWAVVAAIVVHLTWGVLLIYSEQPLNCTPMADSPFRENRFIASAVYLGAAATALLPFVLKGWDYKFRGLACCLPQQALMMLSATTAIKCVVRGAYADGVPRPWEFIAADQAWTIVGMLLHTVALLDWFVSSPRETLQ